LGQQGHPIAFFSKKLSPRLQAKSAYVREMLAITEAVAKFRHYLLGHRFVIKIDHKSLRPLMDQVLQTPEQQQWMHKLMVMTLSLNTNLAHKILVLMPYPDWTVLLYQFNIVTSSIL